MSHRNPRERFDYKSWFERNVAKRTVAALEARDAEFAEKHADTPLAHLAQYVGNRAELLRHTPSPCEIDGGTFIEERSAVGPQYWRWHTCAHRRKSPS